MAESWYNPETKKENELLIDGADGVFDTKELAYDFAYNLDITIDDYGYENTEYGIGEVLIKDGKDVKLI